MDLQKILPLFFYVLFTIYVTIGSYVIFFNAKSLPKYLFFIMCMILSLWCFAYAFAITSYNPDTIYFWRYFSVFGFGTLYFVYFLFAAISVQDTLMLKKRVYILMAIPFFSTGLLICLRPEVFHAAYDVRNTVFGYIFFVHTEKGALYLSAYYLFYLMLASALLFIAYKKTRSSVQKRERFLLLMAFSVTLTLNIISNAVLWTFHSRILYSIHLVTSLVPVSAILYNFRGYYLVQHQFDSIDDSVFYNNKLSSKKQIFFTLAFLYIVFGLLHLGMSYIIVKVFVEEGIFAGLYAFISGLVIFVFQRSKRLERYVDRVSAAIIVFSVPIILFTFRGLAAVTVWVFPLLLLFISILFKRTLLLRLIAVVSLLCYVFIAATHSTVVIPIHRDDHVFRILFFLVSTYVAYYIQQSYLARFVEVQRKTDNQRAIAEVSNILLRGNASYVEEYISAALKVIGNFFDVDRVFLYRFSDDKKKALFVLAWNNPESAVQNDKDASFGDLPSFCIKQLKAKKKIVYSDIQTHVSLTDREKKFFGKREIVSTLCFPLIENETVAGFLGVHDFRYKKAWTEDNLQIFRIFTNLFSTAILKIENEKYIEHMAYHDVLTGLPNRMYFNRFVSRQIKNNADDFAVLFIDLDSFKNINDSKGHEYGDKVLLQTSQRLKKELPSSAVICRFGGDEFLIFLPAVKTDDEIKVIVKRLMKTLGEPMGINDDVLYVTFSCGIALFPKDGKTVTTLIKYADSAMYVSKSKGKNCFTFCNPTLKKNIAKKIALHQMLYTAVENNELVLHYQPQINLSTGEIFGVEALLHWANKDFGIVSPTVFVPLSEQTGLIEMIGNWVLNKACEQLHLWQQKGIEGISMAVNISPRQFENSQLNSLIGGLLKKYDLPPSSLNLEITESVYLSQNVGVEKIMIDLKRLGVNISIDDFATEYSCLTRLKHTPIDKIKLSDTFVKGIGEDKMDEAIIRSMIILAENLQVKIVAEGVEKKEQADFLKQNGCTLVQGFYFYKPMSADDTEQVLKSNPLPPPPLKNRRNRRRRSA